MVRLIWSSSIWSKFPFGFAAVKMCLNSFGFVYIGSWDQPGSEAAIRAAVRAVSVFVGCLIATAVSVCIMPLTSLEVITDELVGSIRCCGELMGHVCHDRAEGIRLDSACLPSEGGPNDAYRKLLEKLQKSMKRGEAKCDSSVHSCASPVTLLPHLPSAQCTALTYDASNDFFVLC